MSPRSQPYIPGNVRSFGQLDWNETVANDDNKEQWTYSSVPSSGNRPPDDENDNDEGEDQEDSQGAEDGPGNRK